MQDISYGASGCSIVVTGSLGGQPSMHLPGAPGPGTVLEDLRRRNAELAEAVAARDTFITVASHELRNPMTPMLGQVDLLLNGLRAGKYSPEQVEQRLERIRQVTVHYLKRTSALLDVSRITGGKLKFDLAPCDLAGLARDVLDTFAGAARHAGSAIAIDAPASLPGTWDRLAMEQVIDNLVSNAIKYGAGQPVAVCVEALGGDVRIRVRDHGPGISPHDRARIFGRFERAIGRSERCSGFGIGLWVVGQLVDAMGGAIAVDDAEGGGTVFDVTVPRHVEANRP